MLSRPTRTNTEALYPSDLNILRAAFDALCQEFAISPDTGAAYAVARELIRLFQTGITEAATLMIAVRARWRDDWEMGGGNAA
ncbi:hypothetical protein [Mesorhizobium sp. M7A.F.Ca.US.008.03.1.1]|uniref:hypothetical protein n=1 Tax=Mesorhizobium sp. M7A.F.Ca.US.008.03.1.1 TaxID=2496742 RepID=UPI000FCAAC9B|nr:hypothetical protein [Mesorhizobium sp. M7A.F.Ca.US.008.03.1.1]RUW61226.1 hypothetical protein EOA16_12760 [Mesorhizobium sp. M7A.F.Ca.US.008.03.1.1]